MRELRPLRLPQLVEARRKGEDESMMDSPKSASSGHALHLSQSSTSSDMPSPLTPTFSLRGHTRYPSSTSSLASSPVLHDSMDGFGTPKRPLTDVKEEPLEREEGFEVVNSFGHDSGCHCDGFEQMVVQTETSITMFTGMPSPGDYDLADSTYGDADFAPNPVAKRRRAADSSITEMATRIGTRFPSFSRKWSTRGGAKTISVAETLKEPSRSRANSTRASSAAGSVRGSFERQEFPLPPTPTRSVFDGETGNSPVAPIDIQKANNATEEDGHEAFASTPLLPPLMVEYPSQVNDDHVQSPLQSPSVAERESSSVVNSPVDAPQLSGLPSPPLSTKPSISSFHKQRAAGLLPSSEIPPIMIASDPNDEWANKLGHANFNIHPEPYVPDTFDLIACKQLRTNWDQARCNFMKQLVRTGEHYGATSKTYKLTEEKWSQIDAQWKKNSELTVARTADAVGEENALSLSQSSVEQAPLMKLPSLNGPRSEGKFPKLEDEDIVGPMEQVAAPSQRRPSRKRTFIKFLQSMLPTGTFGRSHSP